MRDRIYESTEASESFVDFFSRTFEGKKNRFQTNWLNRIFIHFQSVSYLTFQPPNQSGKISFQICILLRTCEKSFQHKFCIISVTEKKKSLLQMHLAYRTKIKSVG